MERDGFMILYFDPAMGANRRIPIPIAVSGMRASFKWNERNHILPKVALVGYYVLYSH